MNKVTEAKKAAEANLIVRREETAAMRSQANTAKVLEGNPTLMRLRELEVLERVATSGKLNVVLGEKGLAERVVNLLGLNMTPGGRERSWPSGISLLCRWLHLSMWLIILVNIN